MKRVTAYQALDNSLHETKAQAAGASILYLGTKLNAGLRGPAIGPDEVAFLIDNREKILPILNQIDAPEVCEA